MEGLDKFLELLGTASFPSTIVGGVIFLFFYLKKQEGELRAELTATLKRLQEEKVALYNTIDKLEQEAEDRESTIDKLRRDLRSAEDDAIFHRRRADRAEALLEINTNTRQGDQHGNDTK